MNASMSKNSPCLTGGEVDMFCRIRAELEKAKAKHPKVCMTDEPRMYDFSIIDGLQKYRNASNETGNPDVVILEEVYELLDAICKCDKAAIVTEAAHVCVVALRLAEHFAGKDGAE